jgi:tetratricopeptide (TPR) repeat protein
MASIDKKILIPLCLIALSMGYYGAEYIVPKYFHPPQGLLSDLPADDSVSTATELISFIRTGNHYVRPTKSGYYLAGKFAQNHKDWDSANNYISNVLTKSTSKPAANDNYKKSLTSHSMVLAMSAGEYAEALKLAYEVYKDDPKNILAMLFVTLDYFKKGQYPEVRETLSKVEEDSIATYIIPVLSFWANTINTDGSVNPNISTEGLLPSNLYAYHALLGGVFTDQKQSVETYALQAFNLTELDVRDAEKMGDLFYLYGQKEVTIGLLKILKDRKFLSTRTEEKLNRLNENKPIDDLIVLPKIQTPKQGAAIVFADMAEILIREYSDDSANVFAQMSLYLDPSLSRPHIIIADIFSRNERLEDAIEELKKITPEDDEYILSQRQISDLYNQLDEDEKAIEILNGIYEQENDLDALNQIGDIHRFNENYEEAAKTYTQIIDTFDKVPEKYWHVLYARGMSYERLGSFARAEKDLLAALEFRPQEPYLLNYLGYSWADQDTNLDQALKLIQQAVALKPNDGYIADSLGWVHYKLQNYEQAIKFLERAVELLPYDPTINEHLGDAYWREGRKQEAKFQWRRALNAQEKEDLELEEKLNNKITSGLIDEDTHALSDSPTPPAASSADL